MTSQISIYFIISTSAMNQYFSLAFIQKAQAIAHEFTLSIIMTWNTGMTPEGFFLSVSIYIL